MIVVTGSAPICGDESERELNQMPEVTHPVVPDVDDFAVRAGDDMRFAPVELDLRRGRCEMWS